MQNVEVCWVRVMRPALALLSLTLALGLAGCTAKQPPLSPQATVFKQDVRGILSRLAPRLVGPLSNNDAEAAKREILSQYPNAGLDKPDFPFWLGVMSKDGILLTALPPVQAIGADFIKYKLVQETLNKKRIGKNRLYSPNGAPIYIVLAPVMDQDNLVGLVGLRLSAAQALKKWGLTEQEFQQMDLN
jgi:hypothetical protein